MKRVHDLRPADFDRVPVWRYEGDDDDTALAHATARTELAESEQDRFIARTQFALANGAQFVGFCSPADYSGLGYLQPVILTDHGPVFFWFDAPPSDEFLRAQWRRLGVTSESVFPIHFRCTVPVDGHYVTGIIEAFDLTGPA